MICIGGAGPSDKLAGLWVPIRMAERYAGGWVRSLVCSATYDNFRQFKVDTRGIINK